MKKNAFIACLLIVSLFMVSCQTETPSIDETQVGETPEWIVPSDFVDLTGMELYWQRDAFGFAPDDNAKLSVYVQAPKDDTGKFMFDDGQDWLLIMETSLGDYLLFPRQYVKLGGVSYRAFIDADNIFHTLVTVSQRTGYHMYDCVFDSDRKAFEKVTVYGNPDSPLTFITNSWEPALGSNSGEGSKEKYHPPYQSEDEFLNSPEGKQFQSTAYGATKAFLSADPENLVRYLSDPKDMEGFMPDSNIFNKVELISFKFSLDSFVSDDEIRAEYECCFRDGDTSYWYVSLYFKKVDGEWKVRFISVQG